MKITEQEIKKITKMYLDGITLREITHRTDACVETVRKYLKLHCPEFNERKKDTFASILFEGNLDRLARLEEEYQNTPNEYFMRKYRVTSSHVIKVFGHKKKRSRNFQSYNIEKSIVRPEPESPKVPVPQEASIKLPFMMFR